MGSGVSRCFMQSVSNRVRPNETPRYAEMQRVETMSGMDVGKSTSSSMRFCCKDSDGRRDRWVLRRSSRQCRGFIKSYLWSRGGEGMYVPCREGEWEGIEKRLQAIVHHTSWIGA